MGSLSETNPSLWVATTLNHTLAESSSAEVPPLPLPTSPVDVVVIGAGITGLTTARLLAADGASVVVLEAGRLSSGVTGYTTAKVSALQGTGLSTIIQQHGRQRTAAYAAANLAAVERVAQFVEEDGIDCDFERAPVCTYAESDDDAVQKVEAEHETATSLGVNTRLDAETELPYPVRAAVWLDNQAQFHPRRYCLGLAEAIANAGGLIVERTRVHDIDEDDDGVTVQTERGELRAGATVVATHLPFLMAGGFFARAHAQRSYALAVRTERPRPRGMYLSADSTTRSIRSTPDDWLIVGGEGHKTGQDDDTRQRYEALISWAKERFQITGVGYQWSAQDYETVDYVPYVGPAEGDRPRTLVATGFRKWGMSNGTAAAMILADRLAGRSNAWAEAYDATRIATTSVKTMITENLNVGKRFFGDRIGSMNPPDAGALKPGEGGIVEVDGEKVAAFRDDDGTLHALSPKCTHMGCLVTFNTAERSWDCPCHGSRFDVDGAVIQGPATKDLESKAPAPGNASR